MKIFSYKYILILSALLFALGSCCDEYVGNDLTPDQQALIGTAVDFSPSMAEEFVESRVSYDHNGRFNEGDLMIIYRQYWDGVNNRWEEHQAFRTYQYDVKYATGTSINLGTEWKVAVGTLAAPRVKCDDWSSETKSGTFVPQTKADSLTWENGSTVRFRAWSRSNVANCIGNGSASNYYPDFCVADWVTVSGPTMGIPLSLRHLCSRVRFSPKPGNQFAGASICLDKEDYMWADNSDSHTNDLADQMTEEQAQSTIDELHTLFNRLCMPAGVDIETGTLRAMTTTLYDNLAANSQFNIIEQKTPADGIVDYGTLTPEQIATGVKHPAFNNVDGHLYMVAIPYDMSNASTQGEILSLPPTTRFKIKIRDVNNGDHDLSTGGYEYKEHIFSLADIKEDGDPKYPEGLPLMPGRSYTFRVGYQYDRLTVSVIEEGINWSTADPEEGVATDQHVAESSTHRYEWWQDAINDAIRETKNSKDYNPIFRITTADEFKEFIALVNGTAATRTSGLERKVRDIDNPDADPDFDNAETRRYWWYDVAQTAQYAAQGITEVDGSPKIAWVTRAEAEAQGYVFYRHYYPQISDKAAYSVEDYLRGPFSFYDEQVNLHLVVQLTGDIDLNDWKLESVGSSALTPFKGFFDGGGHTLSNVNMREEYLFGHLEDGELRNLRLTSTHNLALLRSGRASSVTRNVRIVGISLKADCTVSPIAQTLTGTSYVVGCIHEGDAGGALVGTADNMSMYGCMHASSNITGAALLGNYPTSNQYLAPQGEKAVLKWSRFMCNYYQKSPTQATRAIGSIGDAYRPQEYIRGARQHILRAKSDNLLGDDVPFSQLTASQREEFYGLAPWKAMNYGIYQYNQLSVAKSSEYRSFPESHQCEMVYQVDPIGYAHLYPQLVPGVPTNGGVKNILLLNN